MNDQLETSRGPQTVTSGEWAGWRTWPHDVYETRSGPFYHREEEDGSVRSAFRAGSEHMNGSGAMHGGCLMTFADYCLFALAQKALAGARGVTVSLNGEFIDAAYVGDLVEGTGEVVRAGKSLIFVRGIVTSAGKPLLTFSGTIKKLRSR